MRLFNAVNLALFLLCILASSCHRKEDAKDLIDLSPKGDIILNHITRLGDDYFIVGGEKFLSARMFHLNNQTLNELSLPPSQTGDLLHHITTDGMAQLVAVGDNGSLYFSQDTGNTWHFQREVLWYEYTGVSFCGKDSLMLSGRNALRSGVNVLCQSNGTHLRGPDNIQLFELDDIQYLHSGIAYTCGYGAVMKTIDGGISWNFTMAKNDFFKAMFWKNEREGIAVGYQGSIVRTTDGGDQFTTFRSANNPFIKHYHWLGIHGWKETIVCVGEKGAILFSHDSGATWDFIKPFTREDLHGVYVINDHECLVCGTGGSLFKVGF